VAVTSNGISETLQQNCEAVDVELLDIEIGTQAVVLVGNAQDEALQCLTTEQLQLAWGAQTEPIEAWNQVFTDFQEKPITLFTDNYGSIHSTLLMLTLGQATLRFVPI
jgi:ABC-type phosphate transport system substrate-binding protein